MVRERPALIQTEVLKTLKMAFRVGRKVDQTGFSLDTLQIRRHPLRFVLFFLNPGVMSLCDELQRFTTNQDPKGIS